MAKTCHNQKWPNEQDLIHCLREQRTREYVPEVELPCTQVVSAVLACYRAELEGQFDERSVPDIRIVHLAHITSRIQLSLPWLGTHQHTTRLLCFHARACQSCYQRIDENSARSEVCPLVFFKKRYVLPGLFRIHRQRNIISRPRIQHIASPHP